MPDRHGPIKTGRFKVDIDDVEVAGFRVVDLPRRYSGTEEYREGNDPDYEKKLWGQSKYDDLSMERGVSPDGSELYDWRQAVEQGRVENGRKKIGVTLLDEEEQPQIRWEFTKAWPKEYDPPELDATADGDIATESVTIAFDKMDRKEV